MDDTLPSEVKFDIFIKTFYIPILRVVFHLFHNKNISSHRNLTFDHLQIRLTHNSYIIIFTLDPNQATVCIEMHKCFTFIILSYDNN